MHGRANEGKAISLRQPPLRKGTKPFEMIHMDLLQGPEAALDGHYKYLLVIIDDYTRYSWVYGLKSKEIDKVWKKWQARILTAPWRRRQKESPHQANSVGQRGRVHI